MPWSKLDDGFHEHPKTVAMSDKAFRLYVCGITYSSRHKLLGKLTKAHVQVLFRLTGAADAESDELVELIGWERDGSGYLIHGFEEYNPDQEEISRRRAEAGRLGGLRSGEVRSKNDAETKQNPHKRSKNEAIASTPPEANAKQNEANGPIPVPDPLPIPIPKEPNGTPLTPRGGRVGGSFKIPSCEEAEAYFLELGLGGQELGRKFCDHYSQSGWKLSNGNLMKDWQSAIRVWRDRRIESNGSAKTDPAVERARAKGWIK